MGVDQGGAILVSTARPQGNQQEFVETTGVDAMLKAGVVTNSNRTPKTTLTPRKDLQRVPGTHSNKRHQNRHKLQQKTHKLVPNSIKRHQNKTPNPKRPPKRLITNSQTQRGRQKKRHHQNPPGSGASGTSLKPTFLGRCVRPSVISKAWGRCQAKPSAKVRLVRFSAVVSTRTSPGPRGRDNPRCDRSDGRTQGARFGGGGGLRCGGGGEVVGEMRGLGGRGKGGGDLLPCPCRTPIGSSAAALKAKLDAPRSLAPFQPPAYVGKPPKQ